MPRAPSCLCSSCETCRDRARSRRRRADPAVRADLRRRARERRERLRADPAAYEAVLAEARERMRETRANGAGPRMRELDRRRRWLRRCLARAATVDEIADRTGQPREVLALVLREEARRPPRRRRVWVDPTTGEFRIVRGRIDADVLEALAALGEP
jgi:hypothetical protein